MEQIVEYSEIKELTDILKTFATIPMAVDVVNGQPKFTIANHQAFIAMITAMANSYKDEDIVITESNISIWEKESANIKKLAEKIKKDAKAYVDDFALELLGRTTGKNKVKGQVHEAEEILMGAYSRIHEKTKAFREETRKAKEEAEIINAEVTNEKKVEAEPTIYTQVKLPVSKWDLFVKFCKENEIEIVEGDKK